MIQARRWKAPALFGVVFAVLVVHASRVEAQSATAQCKVFEIKASNSGKGLDKELKPLKKKFKKPPFSAWDTFELLAKHAKSIALKASLTLKLKTGGKLSLMYRGHNAAKGKLSDKIYLRGGVYRVADTQPLRSLYLARLQGTPKDYALISAMPARPNASGAVQRKSGRWYEGSSRSQCSASASSVGAPSKRSAHMQARPSWPGISTPYTVTSPTPGARPIAAATSSVDTFSPFQRNVSPTRSANESQPPSESRTRSPVSK